MTWIPHEIPLEGVGESLNPVDLPPNGATSAVLEEALVPVISVDGQTCEQEEGGGGVNRDERARPSHQKS